MCRSKGIAARKRGPVMALSDRVECRFCGTDVDIYEEDGAVFMVSHRDYGRFPDWCDGSDVRYVSPIGRYSAAVAVIAAAKERKDSTVKVSRTVDWHPF